MCLLSIPSFARRYGGFAAERPVCRRYRSTAAVAGQPAAAALQHSAPDMELGQWVIWVIFHVRVTGSSFSPGVRHEFFRFSKKCPKCKTYIWKLKWQKSLSGVCCWTEFTGCQSMLWTFTFIYDSYKFFDLRILLRDTPTPVIHIGLDFTPPPIGEQSIVMTVSVRMSVCVCMCVFVSEHTSRNTNFCACYRWPWLGPALAVSRYVRYFRFYTWRHACA